MGDKLLDNERGDRDMPTAIKEAIDSERRVIDSINAHLLEQIQILQELTKLPDDNPHKLEMQKEIHQTLMRVGIITETNELTENYK